MVTYNKKQKNKRKIPAVLPAAVGSAVGIGGTAALTRAYLLRQQEYANNEKNASLYEKGKNGNEGIFGKGQDGKYIKAGDDGVYTQEEYVNAVKDHYYNGDKFDETTGVTQEYADSIIEQAQNDPNLFITQKIYDSGKSDKLTAAFNKVEGTTIQESDFNNFLDNVEGQKLTADQFKKGLKTYLKDIKDTEGTPKYGEKDIDKVVEQVTGTSEAFVDTKVVNTEYADNAAVYEKMSNNATKQNFSFIDSLKDARTTAAEKIGNNSLIFKEIAKSTGADVTDVALKTVDATAALGFGLAAGLAAMGANKLFKKVGNYLNKKKEERAEKKEQKVAEMKRSLSQAKAANAMQVQMAGDFENTASNGRFNNRG